MFFKLTSDKKKTKEMDVNPFFGFQTNSNTLKINTLDSEPN